MFHNLFYTHNGIALSAKRKVGYQYGQKSGYKTNTNSGTHKLNTVEVGTN